MSSVVTIYVVDMLEMIADTDEKNISTLFLA